MTERPILFSAPMIKALLAGNKTQTRRVLGVKKGTTLADVQWADRMPGEVSTQGYLPRERIEDPRYAVGDRLWVREAWRTFVSLDKVKPSDLLDGGRGGAILYEADGAGLALGKAPDDRERHYSEVRDDFRAFGKLRSGMFMPRWASRITLVVTDVRVQRLQEISAADAQAEGITPLPSGRYHCGHDEEGEITCISPITAYAWLWDSLNSKRGYPWQANPWVAATTFEVEQ